MRYSEINLDDLDGENGFSMSGVGYGDRSGWSVSGAGDVNDDGISDLIIGTPRAPVGDSYSAGISYVVFGSAEGYASDLDLDDLDGDNGFRIVGVDGNDNSGREVAAAGDVNGDGIADLIIGAPLAARGEDGFVGESYVVFGTGSGFSSKLELEDLDGDNGFRIRGIEAGDNSGFSVSGAGDVNGDGIDDVIIGARYANDHNDGSWGEAYVVYGSDDGFGSRLDLEDLNGTNGFRIVPSENVDYTGWSVSGAGDVNGDGIADMIVGARGLYHYGSELPGEVYVVFGSEEGFSSSLDLGQLDGSNGFRIHDDNGFDHSVTSVAGAGDVNGDGFDDVIVGALGNEEYDYFSRGGAYVVYGSASPFAPEIDRYDLDGSNGFLLYGEEQSNSGRSVAAAGDVNGDGIGDIIVGAPRAGYYGFPQEPDIGQAYVIFGSESGLSSNWIDNFTDNGEGGFIIHGRSERDYTGRSVAGAGDINGDGVDDLIVGAWGAELGDIDGAGASYVIFGVPDNYRPTAVDDVASIAGLTSLTIDVLDNDTDREDDPLSVISFTQGEKGTVTETSNGRLIYSFERGEEGRDTFEYTIDDGNGHSHAATVTVRGIGAGVNLIADSDANTLRGSGFDDTIRGGGGNDLITGEEGNDVLKGGSGRDAISGNGGDDKIRGNNGHDQLYGNKGEDSLYGGDGDDYVDGGRSRDRLRGQDGEDELRGGNSRDDLSGGDDDDKLYGENGDDTLSGDRGDDALKGGSGDDVFEFKGKSRDGQDTIKDFEDGSDLIRIGNDQKFRDLDISEKSGGVSIEWTSKGGVFLKDFDLSNLGASDFDFI